MSDIKNSSCPGWLQSLVFPFSSSHEERQGSIARVSRVEESGSQLIFPLWGIPQYTKQSQICHPSSSGWWELLVAFEGRRKVGVHYCFCSTFALVKYLSILFCLSAVFHCCFQRCFGSFWPQMPGQKRTNRNWQKQLWHIHVNVYLFVIDCRAESLNLCRETSFYLPQSQLKHVGFALKMCCLLFCSSLLSCAPCPFTRCFLGWSPEAASWRSLWSCGDRRVCTGRGSQLLDTSAESSQVHPGWGSQAASPHYHLSQVRSSLWLQVLLFVLLDTSSFKTFH